MNASAPPRSIGKLKRTRVAAEASELELESLWCDSRRRNKMHGMGECCAAQMRLGDPQKMESTVWVAAMACGETRELMRGELEAESSRPLIQLLTLPAASLFRQMLLCWEGCCNYTTVYQLLPVFAGQTPVHRGQADKPALSRLSLAQFVAATVAASIAPKAADEMALAGATANGSIDRSIRRTSYPEYRPANASSAC
jgi:hypothetical protein